MTNNEEKHDNNEGASRENFDSSNNNNQERRTQSDEKSDDNSERNGEQPSGEREESRRPRRPRVGAKAYTADPNNKFSGPTRPAPLSRFSSSDRNRDSRDRYPSSDRGDRYPSSDRGDRFSSPDRGDRYSSSDRGDRFSSPDRGDRYSSPDRGDRYPSSDRGDRYSSSDRGDRFSSPDRGDRYPSSDRGGDRYSSPSRGGGGDRYPSSDRGNRFPSNRGGRDQQSGFQPRERRSFNASSAPRKSIKPLVKKEPFKQIKYKESADPTAPIRLNKYIANAGVCSRREADDFIVAGAVKVNGVVMKELGTKITRADTVLFHDKPIELESKIYVLLNKPKGFVTTTDDPENRKTVMDLVRSACSERIYPVGRLDRGTTGVLLLTNDGDLASKLTHPRYEKRKIYQVWTDKPVTPEHMQEIADGIELEDGPIDVDAISYVTEEDLTQIGIEIHSGKNRIVRRIFEKFDYRVLKLDRVYFAGLTKKNLSRGRWRYLTEKEVNMLRMGAFD